MEATRRVLIVDNDEAFLRSTSELLSEEGYICDCVKSADEARNAISNHSYQLSIADIDMPGNKELELVRDLQNIQDPVPVILVTDHPSVDSAIETFGLPVSDYLTKPLDSGELLAKVRLSVERSEILRAIILRRKKQQQWHEELIELEDLLQTTRNLDNDAAIVQFQAITLLSITHSLSSLKHINDSLLLHRDEQSVRLAKLTTALQETIEVLMSTKTAFKSKELGTLRRSLEKLLGESDSESLLNQ